MLAHKYEKSEKLKQHKIRKARKTMESELENLKDANSDLKLNCEEIHERYLGSLSQIRALTAQHKAILEQR